jgi:hypothetical protein
MCIVLFFLRPHLKSRVIQCLLNSFMLLKSHVFWRDCVWL